MAKKTAYPLIENFDNIPEEALLPEEEQPYPIPVHWKWVRLGYLGTLKAGTGFPKSFQGKSSGDYPFMKVGTLKYADASGNLSSAEDWIVEDVRKTLKATLVPKGSIIFAKIGEAIKLNRRAITSVPSCIDNNMFAFTPNSAIDLQYLYTWFTSVDLYTLTTATTTPSLRKGVIEALAVPLPPMAEQVRIVSKLSKINASVHKVVVKSDAAEKSLKKLEDRLLSYTLSGRATAHLGFSEPNEIIADLPESAFVPEDEQPYPIPNHWRWVKFGFLAQERKEKTLDFSGHKNFIGLDNLRTGGGLSSIQDVKGIKSAKTIFKPGDLLYGKLRPYLNKHYVVDFDGVCSTDILAFVAGQHISVDFLELWVGSIFFQMRAVDRSTGDRPRISPKMINLFPVPLPPKNEQKEILDIYDLVKNKAHQSAEAIEKVGDFCQLLLINLTSTVFREKSNLR
ncbi:hypothetical protein BSR29_07670 [Boudabousia liubingyangii]|uniref:Type I restriction modification DNA specificity domain-containing protein n=1 Tax=Boudabousia liubingyangii TaxID=1921764 RepID=A0A1Q5PJM1_9ACTO|nr:restriction endonuclease subunit S [Boudabousia liubingyangii]OKL46125.1 hypothetical protein BSR29_07670 [Boudabousia liubingyangii]